MVYVEEYIDGYYDDGSPHYTTTTWYSDAIITGTVSSNHNMKIQGVSVAVKDDKTEESWVADPIPFAHYGGTITNIFPASSDTGRGKILTGSSTANLDGQPIALIGSQVETCLGTITTIETGNTKMNFTK
ncbi:putative Zn-binding protein involved in type VI secretion [Paenibacillus turicensis]|uniref:Zn-binding protein involved in type VI secretion n=1 Tax=Paenibacillus turicensis TaxID=160487 RepID=A0ABS4FVU7_9BACL|nr:hypothetical protein [Paenibacillus turicensis]MBP1906687.1 putative Zn-binding protein involved in type VI secretion [Paenibacillus turicensis]